MRANISRVRGFFRQFQEAQDRARETLEENIISVLQGDPESNWLEEIVLEEMKGGHTGSSREEGVKEAGDSKVEIVETSPDISTSRPKLRKPKVENTEPEAEATLDEDPILPPVPFSFEEDEEPRMKKYFKLPALVRGDEKRVKIGVVGSPEYFTVYFSYSDGYFIDMQMQQELQEVSESELEPLRLVEVDNACLIKVVNVFYRGKVVGIIDQEMIRVLLVDTGELEVRSRLNIYEIEERFTNIAETSQKVSLACVRPVGGRCWPSSSTSALRERIGGKEFLMFVQEEKTAETPLSVILYETRRNKDVCINFWLSSVGQATLTTDACMRLEYFKPTVERAIPVDADDSKETDTFNTFSARVVAIESPSNISVICLRNEPDLERLQYQMQDHYGNSLGDSSSTTSMKDLAVGLLVAAHIDRNGGTWARGKIKNFMKMSGKAVVQLIDFAETQKIKVEKLQPLGKMFKKVFMEKVHLSGVSPTNTSGNWSKETTEGLRQILQKSSMKVQLRCLGRSANQSLPVKMLMVDETGDLVDVEDEMVAARLALGVPVFGSSGDDGKRATPPPPAPPEMEEIEIKRWTPPENLEPGTSIERATASYVDWSGRLHLVRDLDALGIITSLLANKYNNSKPRPGKSS